VSVAVIMYHSFDMHVKERDRLWSIARPACNQPVWCHECSSEGSC